MSEAWDIALLALCVWREARGEPHDGKLGVAWSIKNRVNKPCWWGNTYPSVILHPWQYSSFNVNDPNATKMPQDPEKDAVWAECMQVAYDVYHDTVADPTLNATHYYSTSMKTPPTWAATAEFKVQLGNQRFYRAS